MSAELISRTMKLRGAGIADALARMGALASVQQSLMFDIIQRAEDPLWPRKSRPVSDADVVINLDQTFEQMMHLFNPQDSGFAQGGTRFQRSHHFSICWSTTSSRASRPH